MRSTRWLATTVYLAAMASQAHAQAPEIGGLLPAGGPRGAATHVRIAGKNLTGARIHLLGTGVAIKSQQANAAGDQLDLEITVDPAAGLGPHELRITTTKGVSNGSHFWVDIYPNHVIEQPMQEADPPLPLNGAPVVINSRIAAKAGRDRFTIDAAVGDTWVFDCFADRIRSRFDPVIDIRNAEGVSMLLVQSTWESDPRFCYKFAKAGKYLVTVRDSEYNGGPNYTYRMLAGQLPYVAGYYPRGERPGHTVRLAVNGTNLTSSSADVLIPAGTATGTFWAEVSSTAGKPMLLPLLVGSEPVTSAADTASDQSLPASPCAIDGSFLRNSRARFAFEAKKGAAYLFDLLGRRIGSRIDGEIRVVDSASKEIAINDDAPGLGKDARLAFTAPSDGRYFAEVRNVEESTGSDCFYRLKVRSIVPDFQVAINTDRLSIPQAGTLKLPVTVEREGGFSGPVEVHLEGLPAGVTATPVNITAASGEITLTAAPGTSLVDAEVHVLGKAAIAGKPVTHEAPAWEQYEHRSIDLLLSVEYSYTRPHHIWNMLYLAVTPALPPTPAKK